MSWRYCRTRVTIVLIVVILTAMVGSVAHLSVYAQGKSQPKLEITAEAAILMEPQSGLVLYEKNLHKQWPPASITKIMTMLLVMEAIEQGKVKLSDKVIASEHAADMGGSEIWLEVGEEMSLEDMMKAIAIVSANDASIAVAEHIAGSEDIFVDMMNAKAKKLGMKNTYFANPTGLPKDEPGVRETVTTAYDIALMSRALLRYPKVHEWFTVWMSHLRKGKSLLVNTNRLIAYYKGADGIKTGYTDQAKYCLSASAVRNNVRMVAVILGADDSNVRFAEAAKLLDYGFRSFVAVELAKAGQVVGAAKIQKGVTEKVKLLAKDRLIGVVPRGEESRVKMVIRLPDAIAAPIAKGQKLGELVAVKDGIDLTSVDALAAEEVKKGSIFRIIFRLTRNLLRTLFSGEE